MVHEPPPHTPAPSNDRPATSSSESLGELPDADRISSVETVRQYVEQHLQGTDFRTVGWTAEGAPLNDCAGASTRGGQVHSMPTEAEDTRTCPWTRTRPSGSVSATAVDAAGALTGLVSPIDQRYEILRRLATGGMAEIYRVRHRSLGKEFALKLVQKGGKSSETHLRQLFLREARLVSRMDHPHIVTVTDFGVDPERGEYIVMEYLRGETLHQRLHRQRRLKVHTALEIGLQVAEALHYMHVQGVIHCDVKAENVFLCRAQSDSKRRIAVKLIDFGLSRLRATGVSLAASQVGGTPQYMAPELIQGAVPQPSMDIYALGVLLFEMIAGVVPFDGASRLDILRAHITETPSLHEHLLEDPLHGRIEEIILTALAKTPEERQRSMGQVIFQLRTLIQMDGIPAAAAVRRPTPQVQSVPTGAYRELVEGSPLPQFQLDAKGHILFANKAFGTFVRARPEEIRGTPIGDTRLGLVYPGVQTDAESCAKRRRGEPMRRAFAFALTDGTTITMLCWMTRQEVAAGKAPKVHGYIHPLH